jgi:hypothetical protein
MAIISGAWTQGPKQSSDRLVVGSGKSVPVKGAPVWLLQLSGPQQRTK